MAEAQQLRIRQVLAKFGKPADVEDPATELHQLLRYSKGLMIDLLDLLQAIAAGTWSEIDDPDIKAAVASGVFEPDHLGDTRRHPLIAEYQQAMVNYGRLLVDCVKIGLDERKLRFEELQLETFGQAFHSTLTAPGVNLSYEQRRMLGAAFAERLRGMDVGPLDAGSSGLAGP